MTPHLARVFDLVTEGDLGASREAWALATQHLATESDPAARLALLEAIAESTDALLGDFGEHGFSHQAPSPDDLAAMVRDAREAVAAMRELRASGVTTTALLGPHNAGRSIAIGSFEWWSGIRNGVSWRAAPGWLESALRRARSQPDE